MQYVYLGRTGLQVSRLGLGTINFGMVTDEAASVEIMDEAQQQGINYIDTADVYSILHESQQMFASKYMLYLPTEKELRKELAREHDQIEIRQISSIAKEKDQHEITL